LSNSQQLKVVNNLSKKTAKIAWKSGAMGEKEVVEGIECRISPNEVGKFVKIFKSTLKKFEYFYTTQKRHDYAINGLIVSVKHSRDWQYHIEIDTNCRDKNEFANALKKINQLAGKLDIKLLDEKQEKAFVDSKIKQKGGQ